jgi:tetratricopeptide (TPR) repeat protein
VQGLEATILEVLETGRRERLDYVLSLEPQETDIFDFSLLLMDAKELFNLGVKQFCHGELADAAEAFLRSSRIDPEEPLTYWNLARLKRIAGNEAEAVESYARASELCRRDKRRGRDRGRTGARALARAEEIEEEMRGGSVFREPVPEDF